MNKPFDFKGLFDAWIADTQKTWAHDRNKSLGASEAFGCLRKAWFKRNGTPKDPDYVESWGAIRRGDIIENNFVVPALTWAAKKMGFEYLLAGGEQTTLFEQEDGYLSVTPDGLITGVKRTALSKYGIKDIDSDCFMLEIKSIDPRVDLSEEKAIHHGQVQIQIGMMRENTAFKPNYAVILYINASFLDDIDVFVVKFDEKKYQIAKDRAQVVFSTDDPDKLMREGRIDNTCQYCSYQQACSGTMVNGMPSKGAKPTNFPPEMRARLEEILNENRAAKFAKDKAEKAHSEVQEKLKNLLREFNISNPKDRDAGWSVSYTLAAGKKSLNREAMEADGIDVVAYEKQGNPYEILRVTYKDPVKED